MAIGKLKGTRKDCYICGGADIFTTEICKECSDARKERDVKMEEFHKEEQVKQKEFDNFYRDAENLLTSEDYHELENFVMVWIMEKEYHKKLKEMVEINGYW